MRYSSFEMTVGSGSSAMSYCDETILALVGRYLYMFAVMLPQSSDEKSVSALRSIQSSHNFDDQRGPS